MTLPFDVNSPPSVPPPGCHDPDVWHEAYSVYARHQPGKYGRCTNKTCGERFPCFPHRLALRSLIDVCTPKRELQPVPIPERIGTHSSCRWCDQPVQLTGWGWLHTQGGFILCQQPKPGAPPLTVADAGT